MEAEGLSCAVCTLSLSFLSSFEPRRIDTFLSTRLVSMFSGGSHNYSEHMRISAKSSKECLAGYPKGCISIMST